MKTLLVALVALAATLPAAHAATHVTVHFAATLADRATLADCDVRVPVGSNVGQVLDQAQRDGCILMWTSDSYPGFGRYVTCINAVCAAGATFWAFYVDDEFSDVGIDGVVASEGASYAFDYREWVSSLVTG